MRRRTPTPTHFEIGIYAHTHHRSIYTTLYTLNRRGGQQIETTRRSLGSQIPLSRLAKSPSGWRCAHLASNSTFLLVLERAIEIDCLGAHVALAQKR